MSDTSPTPSPIDTEGAAAYGITESERAMLDNWFQYHPPTPDQIPIFEQIRDAGHQMAETIFALVPNSPDRTAAIRHIREAVMNANASLACYPEGTPPR